MVSLSGILKVIIWTFVIFGIFKIATTDKIDQEIKDSILQQAGDSQENAFWALIYAKTLDELTPQFKLYNIPYFPGSDILLVNRFVWIGWSHILMFSLFGAIFSIFMKIAKIKIWPAVLIMLALLILSYITATLISYALYLYSASHLGITSTEANTIIKTFSEGLKNIITTMIAFSVISFYSIGKIFFSSIKGGRPT